MARRLAIDTSEGVARLACPGSRLLLLRPPGWGCTALLDRLGALLRCDRSAFDDDAWIMRARPQLLRNPAVPVLAIDVAAAAAAAAAEEESSATDGGAWLKREVHRAAHAAAPDCYLPPVDNDDMPPREFFAAAAHAVWSAHGRRVSVTINRYDAPALLPPPPKDAGGDPHDAGAPGDALADACAVVDEACALINDDSVGFVLATGTHRYRHGLEWRGMRDLTLDLEHNDTVGVAHATLAALARDGDGEGEGKANAGDVRTVGYQRLEWDDERGAPVRRASNASASASTLSAGGEGGDARAIGASIDRFGGYWWGGVDGDGAPALVCPLGDAAAAIAPPDANDDDDDGADSYASVVDAFGKPSWTHVKSLVGSVFDHAPLKRYADAEAKPPPPPHDTGKLNVADDFPALLLRSGALTLARDRAVRFDEFHTYAFMRLRVPNERARARLLRREAAPALAALLAEDGKGSDGAPTERYIRYLAEVADLGGIGGLRLGDLSEALLRCGEDADADGQDGQDATQEGAALDVLNALATVARGAATPAHARDAVKLLLLCTPRMAAFRANPAEMPSPTEEEDWQEDWLAGHGPETCAVFHCTDDANGDDAAHDRISFVAEVAAGEAVAEGAAPPILVANADGTVCFTLGVTLDNLEGPSDDYLRWTPVRSWAT